MAVNEKGEKVRFIRVKGKVVPIRDKGNAPGKTGKARRGGKRLGKLAGKRTSDEKFGGRMMRHYGSNKEQMGRAKSQRKLSLKRVRRKRTEQAFSLGVGAAAIGGGIVAGGRKKLGLAFAGGVMGGLFLNKARRSGKSAKEGAKHLRTANRDISILKARKKLGSSSPER